MINLYRERERGEGAVVKCYEGEKERIKDRSIGLNTHTHTKKKRQQAEKKDDVERTRFVYYSQLQ